MPVDVATLLAGINTADSLLGKVLNKRGTRITKKILAVSTMQEAINQTELYLAESERNFVPNANLSHLWNEAFTAMIPVDKGIAASLRQKSRFWSNPQRWINEEGAMELIPDLNELNQKCEMLLIELDKRS